MNKAILHQSQRLYGFLLKFYPRSYRQEFGEEMQYVFSESLKDAYTENGEPGVISLWGRTIIDAGKSLVIQHIGTGTGTVNRKVIEINLKFGLEYGKVTILPKSLNITLSYKDPGRIDYINYRHRMEAVSAAQIDEILASLKKLENFDQWRLAGAGSSQ